MTVRLLPTGYPENRDPANIKAWADYHNHILIGAYLHKYADLFTQISNQKPGIEHVMPLDSVSNLLGEIAWEIEGMQIHQRAEGWDSHVTAHQLLSKCFNGE